MFRDLQGVARSLVDAGIMAERYPAVEPYESSLLEVGEGHLLYWETVGNPAVYLHGGLGGGSTPGARRHFEPGAYRAVLFGQRGCGRSRPLASEPDTELSTNTTTHLVADIERLREHLRIDRWVVVGVSWGVTLALVYARAHPERVTAMVLGAVTAGTRQEIDWITRDMGRVFPREWEAFAAVVPGAERMAAFWPTAGPGRYETPGRHPGHDGPRPIRHFQPSGHRLGPAPSLAKQPARRR